MIYRFLFAISTYVLGGAGVLYANSAVPVNAEQAVPGVHEPSDLVPLEGLGLYVDGVSLYEQPARQEDEMRRVDVALDAMDLQVAYDNLHAKPVLNINAARNQDGQILFAPYWNYSAWISQPEIRIFSHGDSALNEPLAVVSFSEMDRVAILEAEQLLEAYDTRSTDSAGVKGDAPVDFSYVLRVYDREGKLFDETRPKKLNIDRAYHKALITDEDVKEQLLSGYGRNHIAKQNIAIDGGTATVSGIEVPEGVGVYVMGKLAPVDREGNFVAEEIVPDGSHNITVGLTDDGNAAMSIAEELSPAQYAIEVQRRVYSKTNDWFYVAVADLTVGKTIYDGDIPLTSDREERFDEDIYAQGRVAGHVEGKLSGGWKLQAMLDTGEEDIEEVLENLDEKNPRAFLRRLDPERHYSVYGDDSTITELAPTQGKFFARVEKDKKQLMWGNYRVSLSDNTLGRLDRSLYGAKGEWVSGVPTSHGEQRLQATAFATSPETIVREDNFLATGGSLYYLQRQDVTIGSEQIRVEVRDKHSGIVKSTRTLSYGEDYDVNYLQGRILLSHPLSSAADDDFLVQSNIQPGDPVFLVVNYEYVPPLTELDDYYYGGRVAGWVNDHVRLGVTGLKDNATGLESELYGGDITLRYTPSTYLKLEGMQSEGNGISETTSYDAGFTFANTTKAGDEGEAWRVEAAVDAKDVGIEAIEASVAGYYQESEAGFSGNGSIQSTAADTQQYGVSFSAEPNSYTNVSGKYDARSFGDNDGEDANVDVTHNVGNGVHVGYGWGYNSNNAGSRHDVGGELGWRNATYSAKLFGQTTVSHDGSYQENDRIGVGGSAKISEKLTLGGEVSDGELGMGARVKADYAYDDDTSYYLGYELTDRTTVGTGTLSALNDTDGRFVVGGRTRYNDNWSAYGEERIDHNIGDGIAGLTHAYGVDFTPIRQVTLGGSLEHSNIEETNTERTSASLTGGYKNGDSAFSVSLEGLWDENSSGNDRNTFLARLRAYTKMNPDWRVQGKFNIATSDDGTGEFFDARFMEGGLGFAYRPVDHNRVNALFQYSFLYDVPSAGQAAGNEVSPSIDYKQRSHLLSADADIALNEMLTLGAKYGLKFGEITSSRVSEDWQTSTVHLGVVGVDWHMVHEWDALVEYRAMALEEQDEIHHGPLVSVYRHVGDNLKVGVGYNFSEFDNDLFDIDRSNQGFFTNVVLRF